MDYVALQNKTENAKEGAEENNFIGNSGGEPRAGAAPPRPEFEL